MLFNINVSEIVTGNIYTLEVENLSESDVQVVATGQFELGAAGSEGSGEGLTETVTDSLTVPAGMTTEDLLGMDWNIYCPSPMMVADASYIATPTVPVFDFFAGDFYSIAVDNAGGSEDVLVEATVECEADDSGGDEGGDGGSEFISDSLWVGPGQDSTEAFGMDWEFYCPSGDVIEGSYTVTPEAASSSDYSWGNTYGVYVDNAGGSEDVLVEATVECSA